MIEHPLPETFFCPPEILKLIVTEKIHVTELAGITSKAREFTFSSRNDRQLRTPCTKQQNGGPDKKIWEWTADTRSVAYLVSLAQTVQLSNFF